MEKEFYLDANVFVYAALDSGEKGKAADLLLAAVQNNTVRAATSVLTYDEVVWNVRKQGSKDLALEASTYFLSLRNLAVIDLSVGLLAVVHTILKRHALSPRDAIHYATLRQRGLSGIVSEDKDFDDPALGIQRHTLLSVKKTLAGSS